MAPPETRTIMRIAGWLAFGHVLAVLLIAFLSALESGDWTEFLLGFPLSVWMSLPVIFAAGFVGASRTKIGAAAFLVLEMGLALSLPALIHAYRDQGAIIGLAFFPVVQAGAILIVFLIALLCGWRMRPNFLKD